MQGSSTYIYVQFLRDNIDQYIHMTNPENLEILDRQKKHGTWVHKGKVPAEYTRYIYFKVQNGQFT